MMKPFPDLERHTRSTLAKLSQDVTLKTEMLGLVPQDLATDLLEQRRVGGGAKGSIVRLRYDFSGH